MVCANGKRRNDGGWLMLLRDFGDEPSPLHLGFNGVKTIIRLLRKLFQETQVVVKKQPQIIHAITQHGKAV